VNFTKIMGRNKKEEKKKFEMPQAPSLNLSSETKRGIMVVIFVVLSLVSLLSVLNVAGSLGKSYLHLLNWLLGILGYFVPALFLLVAVLLAKHKLHTHKDQEDEEDDSAFYWRVYLGSMLLTGSLAGLVHIFILSNNVSAFFLASEGRGGGMFGAVFSFLIYGSLGFLASAIILVALLVIGILVAFDVPLSRLWAKKPVSSELLKVPSAAVKINSMASGGFTSEKVVGKNPKVPEPAEEKPKEKPVVIKAPQAAAPALENMVIADRTDWKLPSFDLLEDNKSSVDSGNIELNVTIIKKTLADFGIEVEMGEVNVGPTVTQYTLRPAMGVKLSQIAALQNDLALALAAQSVRMELPIPGKPLVGIEVPNKTKAKVVLREVLQTKNFVDHPSRLAFALGRDVSGQPIIADLAAMPHILVAGTTGSGKSVGINTLLISFLYRNTPQDVKFIVVDPKRVEMTPYNGIPHLLTPVITDHEKAVNALKWAVSEMDRRYRLLSEVGKRNISEYNEMSELKMHYIVIIIDELADLMQVAKADVESAIVRIAQMARAVGIHLVVATQRPSVDIITGLIKANITSRIAFAVGSQIDSRTILDSGGAEKLLGKGDMLFITTEFNQPKRIQGAFIGEKEVKKVVDFFKAQTGAVLYNEEIVEKPKRVMGIPGFEGGDDDGDDLLEAAKEEVTRAGKASASLLQRRLRVGYARAARLLDLLEQQGIIGPGDGAKPREVYGVSSAEKAEYGVEETPTDDQQA
jgi:S-DNA-T family DNA segregation ATPase FtsK/SpoIIIE